jgi:hypothetical protein
MILASHGIIASQIASFDADAVAFFTRVTTAGGTLSATEKQAVNQLVLDLKANSLWTPMKALYPMVGASAAACAQNLKSSSFTGTFTSGWTFASTGVTPNGTSAYFDTTLAPNGNLSLNSTHLSFYSRTLNNTNQIDMAAIVGNFSSALLLMATQGSNDGLVCVNDGGFRTGSGNSQAFFLGNRTVSTTNSVFRNNTKTSFTQNSATLVSFSVALGGANIGGTVSRFTDRQYAFASIGDGLTDTQASNFYTAVQAFQTTLSRQV